MPRPPLPRSPTGSNNRTPTRYRSIAGNAGDSATLTVITVPANELVAQIHERMLAILPNDRFARWLSDETDPRELLVPFARRSAFAGQAAYCRWRRSARARRINVTAIDHAAAGERSGTP